MTKVSVGGDFQYGRFRFIVGTVDGYLGLSADFVDVFSVYDVPCHVVGFCALCEAVFVGTGAFLAGSHGVAVVLDDVDDWDIMKFCDIE